MSRPYNQRALELRNVDIDVYRRTPHIHSPRIILIVVVLSALVDICLATIFLRLPWWHSAVAPSSFLSFPPPGRPAIAFEDVIIVISAMLPLIIMARMGIAFAMTVPMIIVVIVIRKRGS